MVESLDEVLKGSSTLIKNKQYFKTKDYLEPFIEKLKPYTSKFICNVKIADQLAVDEDKTSIMYNKVNIMGVFDSQYDILINSSIFHRVVCMAYAIDVKSPYCKFYTGVIDGELNFYAFGGDCIQLQKIEPETPIDFTGIETLIQNGLNDNCQTILIQNNNRCINKADIFNLLGEWVDYTLKKEYVNDAGKVKLSNSFPIEAYKLLTMQKDSNVYEEGNSILISNILKAFLSQITNDDKDIINRYEKTQLVNNLLKL